MDNEFDLESFVNALGLNIRGSFNGNFEHRSKSSVDIPSLKIASQIDGDKHLGQAQTKIISSRYNEKSPFVERSSNGVDWNVPAVICGDDSSGFSDEAFYGSGSVDGASHGFWEISWYTLHVIGTKLDPLVYYHGHTNLLLVVLVWNFARETILGDYLWI